MTSSHSTSAPCGTLPLGPRHRIALHERRPVLIVTFERAEGCAAAEAAACLADDKGWSHMRLVSEGETWFRAPEVHDHFDRMTETGAFERFESVLFCGAAECGYAAAAHSVAAPGARVLLFSPRATADPERTGWDPRLKHMRRTDFTSRYGYAPRLLEAASQAFVVHDPYERLDAMHAALMMGPNAVVLPARRAGEDVAETFARIGALRPLLIAAVTGALDLDTFGELWRMRREECEQSGPPEGYLGEAGLGRLARAIRSERTGAMRA